MFFFADHLRYKPADLTLNHLKESAEYLPVIPWVFMKYRWIFEQFFGIFSVFHRKNTKKLREYHRYFLKTHGITVLSYNYLIFTHHKALYRKLTGVKRDFFKRMYSSSMMNANVNNSKRHNSERQQL